MSGTLPDALASSTFSDREWVNEVKWYQRVFRMVNAIRQALAPMQTVWVASYNGAAVSTTSGVYSIIALDTIIIDTKSIGISGGGFVAPADGVYEISAMGGFASQTAGTRRTVVVSINGNTSTAGFYGGQAQVPPPTGSVLVATAPALFPLRAGDTVKIGMFQDSAVNVATTTGATARPTLSIRRWS